MLYHSILGNLLNCTLFTLYFIPSNLIKLDSAALYWSCRHFPLLHDALTSVQEESPLPLSSGYTFIFFPTSHVVVLGCLLRVSTSSNVFCLRM